MKRFIIFILVAFFPLLCFAVEEDLTILWDYPNPPTDLAGFELRINGDNSTMIEIESNQQAWADTLDLVDDVNSFELRAKDLGGQVSSWAVVHYDPVPGAPHITCITFQSR